MNAPQRLNDVVAGPGTRCIEIKAGAHPFARLDLLRAAVRDAAAGECVMWTLRLDIPWPSRLIAIALLRWRLLRVERTIARAGGLVEARYGVDPNLDAFACIYELGTVAAAYANRCLRPRGSAVRLRAILTHLFGCDPALGAVVVVGRKQ